MLTQTHKNVEIVKTLELGFACMQMRSDGIISFIPSTSCVGLSTQQIEEIYQATISLTNNNLSPIFVDLTTHISLNSEEKNLISSKLSSCLSACAIKEDNILIRFVVHAFNYLYKPSVPIKMFKTEEDAILWLNSF